MGRTFPRMNLFLTSFPNLPAASSSFNVARTLRVRGAVERSAHGVCGLRCRRAPLGYSLKREERCQGKSAGVVWTASRPPRLAETDAQSPRKPPMSADHRQAHIHLE